MAHDLLFTNETEWNAQDLRALFDLYGEGVLAAGDLEVTAGGVGLSIDVAAGSAFVASDEAGDQGAYRVNLDVPLNSAAFVAGGIEAADGALPRVDRIVAHAYDDEADGSGITAFRLEVVTGVPTAGATLANNNGIAAMPNNALLLARVLIEAGDVAVDPLNIADERSVVSVGGGLADHGATHTEVGTDPIPTIPSADEKDALGNYRVGPPDFAAYFVNKLEHDEYFREDTTANRGGTQTGGEGRFFRATDTGIVYQDRDPVWVPVAAGILRKPADQVVPVNNSIVRVDDDFFVGIPILGGQELLIEGALLVSAGSATSDFRMRFAAAGGAITAQIARGFEQGGVAPATAGVAVSGLGSDLTFGSAAGTFPVGFLARFVNTGADATLKLTWAQVTATAENTNVLKNSILRIVSLTNIA